MLVRSQVELTRTVVDAKEVEVVNNRCGEKMLERSEKLLENCSIQFKGPKRAFLGTNYSEIFEIHFPILKVVFYVLH